MAEIIGLNIVRLPEFIKSPSDPPPHRNKRWQLEGEHIIALAHFAKEKEDFEELESLDKEAKKLVEERESELSSGNS